MWSTDLTCMIQGYALTAHPNRRHSSLLPSTKPSASRAPVFSRASQTLSTGPVISGCWYYNPHPSESIYWTHPSFNSAPTPLDIRSIPFGPCVGWPHPLSSSKCSWDPSSAQCPWSRINGEAGQIEIKFTRFQIQGVMESEVEAWATIRLFRAQQFKN